MRAWLTNTRYLTTYKRPAAYLNGMANKVWLECLQPFIEGRSASKTLSNKHLAQCQSIVYAWSIRSIMLSLMTSAWLLDSEISNCSMKAPSVAHSRIMCHFAVAADSLFERICNGPHNICFDLWSIQISPLTLDYDDSYYNHFSKMAHFVLEAFFETGLSHSGVSLCCFYHCNHCRASGVWLCVLESRPNKEETDELREWSLVGLFVGWDAERDYWDGILTFRINTVQWG